MKVKVNKKKISIILVLVLAVFLTGNAFAALVGAPNIFFAIKDLVVHEEITGSENLFSDRDITISYSSIKIKDGLKLQINRVLIEEDKSTLFITLKNENKNDEEIGVNVFDLLENENINNVIAEEKLLVGAGNIEPYEVILEKKVSETEKILLEIIIDKKEVGRNIIIDLASKEIIVKGEDEVNKISEKELKQYLNIFSVLNIDTNWEKNDKLIYIAQQLSMLEIFETKVEDYTQRDLINRVIDSLYADELDTEELDNGVEVLKLNDIYYNYNEEDDTYSILESGCVPMDAPRCLAINDISYKDGVYTAEYVYMLVCEASYLDESLLDTTQYKATIEFEFNEESEYSKYKILSLSESEVLKDVQDDISDEIKDNKENDNEIIDNAENETKDDEENQESRVFNIEGEYAYKEELEKISYVFDGEEVKLLTLATKIGTYEIKDNKIKIKFIKLIEPDSDKTQNIDEEKELVIEDENTLFDEKYNAKYIKEKADEKTIEPAYVSKYEIICTPNTAYYNFQINSWENSVKDKYYVAKNSTGNLCIIKEDETLIKEFDIIIKDTLTITSAYCTEWENNLIVICNDRSAYDINLENYEYKEFVYASGY